LKMKQTFIVAVLLLMTTVVYAQKDPRVREYLSPKRILWQSDQSGKYVNNANCLLKQGNGQAELINKDMLVLKSSAGQLPGILLDYGKELHGGIQLVTGIMEKHGPVKVRIRFGESASEAMADIDTLKGATNDHAIRDLIVELPWLGGLELGNTGFRFVRIDLVEPGSELILKEVRAVSVYRDIPYLGSFHSSDERLNKIWATGAYTVHLNMQQYLWDGIKRDRLVWVGDMHPEVMTINTVFGYNEVVPQSLDLIKEVTPLPEWMNGISSYSMWWVRIQRDWYQYQGNLDFLKQQRSYLVGLLNHLITKVKGNEENLDGMRFMDWPSYANKPAVHAGLQAMMVMTLNDGAELCHILGEEVTATKCESVVKRLRKSVPDAGNNKQAAALLALAGLMPAEKANKDIIAVGGTDNFSTFYGYYMLQAKAKAGDYQGAIDNIRAYWGGMLELGATSFWEDFDLSWMKNAGRIDELVPSDKLDVHASYGAYSYKKLRHSLAHGWASGPTSWLTEHVLGVQVIAPGCKVIKIEPHLGDLKFVEGTFPTPYGVVKIKHTKMGSGEVKTEVDAPKEVRVIR
jgi:alpha-L-rhamnosidase